MGEELAMICAFASFNARACLWVRPAQEANVRSESVSSLSQSDSETP